MHDSHLSSRIGTPFAEAVPGLHVSFASLTRRKPLPFGLSLRSSCPWPRGLHSSVRTREGWLTPRARMMHFTARDSVVAVQLVAETVGFCRERLEQEQILRRFGIVVLEFGHDAVAIECIRGE